MASLEEFKADVELAGKINSFQEVKDDPELADALLGAILRYSKNKKLFTEVVKRLPALEERYGKVEEQDVKSLSFFARVIKNIEGKIELDDTIKAATQQK